jgi:hypothetical protein
MPSVEDILTYIMFRSEIIDTPVSLLFTIAICCCNELVLNARLQGVNERNSHSKIILCIDDEIYGCYTVLRIF